MKNDKYMEFMTNVYIVLRRKKIGIHHIKKRICLFGNLKKREF